MKSHIKLTALTVCLLWLMTLTGCGQETPQQRSFQAMDTLMQLTVYGEERTASAIQNQIATLDERLSATGSGSDIYRLNRDGSAVPDELTAKALRQSLEYCQDTGGALDISVYPLVCEWGFISGDHHIPSQDALKRLLQKTDYRKVLLRGNTVSLPKGVQIDLGATAKGFAADEARAILQKDSCRSAILNLGGTVLAHGSKPDGSKWRVGIADPDNSADYMGYVECADKIVATSGNYERYFTGSDGKRYCHIIDPKTGFPADNGVVSVSVVSDSGVQSDSLSTALFVMGRDKAMDYWQQHRGFDMIILTDDKQAFVTQNLARCFQLKNEQYHTNTIK